MVIVNSRGERVVDAEDFWIGPSVDITRMTILQPGDLLKAIRIPATWADAEFYFEKVSDRKSWDFPLVNVAAAKVVRGRPHSAGPPGGECGVRQADAPCGCGGECHRRAGERRHRGDGGSGAECGGRPLNYNHFKVPLMKNLVKRAIRGVGA